VQIQTEVTFLFLEKAPPTRSRSKNVSACFQPIGILVLISALLTIAVGCGSISSSGSTQHSQPPSQIQVAVSPRNAVLSPGTQEHFTATVQGTSNTAVTWAASAGSISSDGTFVAPVVSDGTQITIIAKSAMNSAQAESVVTIQRPVKLAIATSPLSGALVNTPYSDDLMASGGTPPYQWTISTGSLPPGISLQATNGGLSGATSQRGAYSFTARVTDAASNSATQSFTLAVSAASNTGYDGPAELPRVYLNTALADTPAPGSTITVSAGGDLQSALNQANCGETVMLQAGATFFAGSTYGGPFTLPAKACDDRHWIVLRTSASDSSLPPEGTRMTPCYAGVASLPGRPVLACTSTKKVLATISYSGTGDGPLIFAPGANHYRLVGLEVTRTANDGKSVTSLIGPTQHSSMSQIVLDRLYIHGTPADETRRGVELSGGTSIAVQDSYISDMHCSVTGGCTDSQAVSGGTGSLPMGPYKINHNFLEAAGENIIFGGGPATQTPADIEIRFNHFFKPMLWLQGQPGFAAPAFIVKNHFELKNAQRVLFDSNALEDTWGGFSQHGYSVLLTPKNQHAENGNVCPICLVTDVTVRYVTIRHVAGAFLIANALSGPNGAPPMQGQRYSIHDVIADDIDGDKYIGPGAFAQLSSIASPLLQDVTINHVTAFPQSVLFNVGVPDTTEMRGIVFTNSIVTSGDSAITSTGPFPNAENCARFDVPSTTVAQCFSNPTFSFNALLSVPSRYPSSTWPRGNFLYAPAAIGFVNFNKGNGGDYRLSSSSPAVGKASDGSNLGANVEAVLSALSRIQ
jgi:hypothetical protein